MQVTIGSTNSTANSRQKAETPIRTGFKSEGELHNVFLFKIAEHVENIHRQLRVKYSMHNVVAFKRAWANNVNNHSD